MDGNKKVNSYNNFNYYNSYSYGDYIKNFQYNPYQKLMNQNQNLYEGKYYPNRHIIPISNTDGSHVFYIKIASDKIGIEKNIREYNKIKDEKSPTNTEKLAINAEYGGSGGRVLIIETRNQKITEPSYAGEEISISILSNQWELNYDGLFGGVSLDYNRFNDYVIGNNYKLELDFSNFIPMDLNRKIKCESCNQEIKPLYFYNVRTGNYYYLCQNKHTNLYSTKVEHYKSKPMNYVEFKYFLRENDVIKF